MVVEIKLSLTGVPEPWIVRLHGEYAAPIYMTIPSTVSLKPLDVFSGLSSQTLKGLVLRTTGAISIRMNQDGTDTFSVAAGGFFVVASYRGKLASPPLITNTSGAILTITGIAVGM